MMARNSGDKQMGLGQSTAQQLEALADFVKQHDDLCINEAGKIQCKSTGHEFYLLENGKMAPQQHSEVIKAYLSGKKYKLAKDYTKSFESYDYILPHKTHPKKLFCSLCGNDLNKIHSQIENHIKGRKHIFRVRDQSTPQKPSIPQAIADPELDSDDGEKSESEVQADFSLAAGIVEEEEIIEDTPFEIVSNEQEVEEVASTMTDAALAYSSGEEEEITADSFLAKRKNKSPSIPASLAPPRKKQKNKK